MTRLVSGALAAAVASVAFAVPAPAQAVDPCYSVPDLPGSCLDQATYDYVVGLQAQRDLITDRYENAVTRIGSLFAANQSLNQQLLTASTAIDGLRAEKVAAQTLADQRLGRIIALRAKVKELRSVIKILT